MIILKLFTLSPDWFTCLNILNMKIKTILLAVSMILVFSSLNKVNSQVIHPKKITKAVHFDV